MLMLPTADAWGIDGTTGRDDLTNAALIQLLDDAPDALVVVDAQREIMLVNRQAESLFGYSREELLGATLEQLLPERFRPGHAEQVRRYAQSPTFRPMSAKAGLWARHKSGREIPIDISLSPVHTASGTLICAAVRDVTERKRIEEALIYQARHDALTEALNRRRFQDLFKLVWNRSVAENAPLACVMLDVDYFKKINDTHGHITGDAALQAIGALLKANAGPRDLICRYGGEEFAVVLADVNATQAADWAERVRAAIAAARIPLDEHRKLEITASLGVACRRDGTTSTEALLELADQAMLTAKETGRNRVISSSILSSAVQGISSHARQSQLLDRLVARDLMTALVACLKQGDAIQSAAEYFLQLRIGAAPVVADDGRLLGIVSERNLIDATAQHNPWLHTVGKCMQADVVAYDEETPARQVLEFLNRTATYCVVVVRAGMPTGIVTRGSLLRWFFAWAQLRHDPPHGSPGDERQTALHPRDRLLATSSALAQRCLDLHRALAEGGELAPRVVAEVTRVQELINDLLGHCQPLYLPELSD